MKRLVSFLHSGSIVSVVWKYLSHVKAVGRGCKAVGCGCKAVGCGCKAVGRGCKAVGCGCKAVGCGGLRLQGFTYFGVVLKPGS